MRMLRNKKPLSKEVLDSGAIVLTVEERFLFGLVKRRIKYSSNKVIVGHFRLWLREPNKTIVPDLFSFQLNHWCDAL